jgi:hypothetical protein
MAEQVTQARAINMPILEDKNKQEGKRMEKDEKQTFGSTHPHVDTVAHLPRMRKAKRRSNEKHRSQGKAFGPTHQVFKTKFVRQQDV